MSSKNGTLYLLNMMSVMMPIEVQIEKVEEALQRYKLIASNEANKNDLCSAMILLITGLQNEGKDMKEIIQQADNDINKLDAIDNIFDAGSIKGGGAFGGN